ncbi:DUF2240 family protein [Archaeoglobus profundus]|uniref:Uncharacterized protein n=1 Tax=Archaeoglobus profundus (strain DSM 5631 / JCM 9629 / NBRC 100127 / Av18) TaxID=572546 RepID=D2RGF4_ARCPA|nr:DUF2240 family protein [Archaeoglobus profundus]ADB57379.1 hypothetical protein Arcpr_0309 [Archaeoglobus profundus DSM 5631]
MDISFDLEYIGGSEENVLDRIISRITEKTGKNAKEVLAEINKKHEELNLLAVEVVALIVAREKGVDISDLIDDVEKKVLG